GTRRPAHLANRSRRVPRRLRRRQGRSGRLRRRWLPRRRRWLRRRRRVGRVVTVRRGIARVWAHLACDARSVRRLFPDPVLERIEQAVSDGERSHGAEVRIAVEAGMHWLRVLRGISPRERAIEVFSELRVWDTEANNGMLVYLLLADHDVEIVADRGYNGKVRPDEWEAVCREMEASLRGGRYEEAVLEGIRGIAELVAPHFPAGSGRGELSDRPAVV